MSTARRPVHPSIEQVLQGSPLEVNSPINFHRQPHFLLAQRLPYPVPVLQNPQVGLLIVCVPLAIFLRDPRLMHIFQRICSPFLFAVAAGSHDSRRDGCGRHDFGA